eukprot:14768834-Ditylum_brightwellii.AAC.1
MEPEAKCFNIKIKRIHEDNITLRSKELCDRITLLEQNITFCGISAHSQNGIAEHHIRTLVKSTQTSLLNAHAQWPEVINMELWTFAFKHAVDAFKHAVEQWINMPRKDL